ncbi:MAG: hypothetical protein ACPLXO_04360 [Desulfurella sp.]|uniref:hypothetical protein n=1 Tax=Desulfurella sp. TaxID=1962857 RepID=UPI003C8E09AF
MLSKAFSWFSGGFELFKQAWLVFVLQTAFIFLTIAVSYLMKIFLLSTFLYIIQLLLTAGMFMSFDNVKNERKITFDNLFDGFSNNFSSLVLLSLIFLIFSLIVSYILVKFLNITNFTTSYKHLDSKSYLAIFLVMIFDIIINFVLILAIPFIAIKKMKILKALQASISICFKHLFTLIFLFFIYIILSVLATFSLLGWLVLFPIGIGSVYTIFKENYSI